VALVLKRWMKTWGN